MVDEFSKLQTGITALSTGSSSIAVDPEVLRELFRDPSLSIQMSELPLAASVHSMRQQVEFKVEPGKTEIKDMSEELPFRQEFPEICARVFQWMSDQQVEWRVHGWNFAITAATGETPAGDLIIGLLKDTPRVPSNLVSAGLSMTYESEEARVTLKLEPRKGKAEIPEVFALANYHFESAPPQVANEISSIGSRLWQDFITTFNHLVERES